MVFVEKNKYGYWIVSDNINNQYFKMRFLYYSKREAVKRFKQYVKENIDLIGAC